MDKRQRFNVGYVLIAFLLFTAFQLWIGYRSVTVISYSELLGYLEQGQVAEVTITESMIEGRFGTA